MHPAGNHHPPCARSPVVPHWPCPEPSRRHGLGGKGQAQAMSSPNPQDNVYSRGGCPTGATPVRTLMAHSRQRCHGEHGPQGLPAPKQLEFRRRPGEGRRKGEELRERVPEGQRRDPGSVTARTLSPSPQKEAAAAGGTSSRPGQPPPHGLSLLGTVHCCIGLKHRAPTRRLGACGPSQERTWPPESPSLLTGTHRRWGKGQCTSPLGLRVTKGHRLGGFT